VRYFPIFLDLDDRAVLVVGGGEQAAQKLRLLAKTKARITVIAEAVTAEIAALASAGRLEVLKRAFRPADVDGRALVFAAGAERDVAAAACARGVPVNVVDGPADSSFLMPAIVDRAPVTVAIGTEGSAPVLARDIKAKLEAWLPANFGAVAARAGDLRDRLKAEIAAPARRRHVWERLLTGAWRQRTLSGDDAGAARELDREIATARAGTADIGSVALIGCGPGDPDLLTLKAQQRLQEADVLVVDRLVNPAILEYARRDAMRIDVGKDPEGPSTDQDEINRILIREGLKGHRVARLKGGDAFIFGRAAEEMTAVRAAGLPVEVIPGITAAHACAASIGLPVTLRRKIRQFSVLTGATADGPLDLDWDALARPGQAFAVYMGVRSAPEFEARLLAAGAALATPVVIVENGTLANERVVATTLDRLAAAIRDKGIRGPAIIFTGLSWEEASLTRPERVEVEGAETPAVPNQKPEKDWSPADVALATFWIAG
jgi:uroporphyrin-III C-methyltransferase/precorrin-2 dehydrogenase/sirohydrochlorin ferrochelatase